MGGENDIKILVAGGPVGDEGDWVMSEIVPDPTILLRLLRVLIRLFGTTAPSVRDFVGEISKQLDFVYPKDMVGIVPAFRKTRQTDCARIWRSLW